MFLLLDIFGNYETIGRTHAIPVLVKNMALKVRLGLDLFAHLSSYEI